MTVEVDQSGKIENTSVITILAFSNNTNDYVYIKSLCKRSLKRYFKEKQKTRSYVYKTFAVLLYLLIKRNNLKGDIYIDLEYPGNMALIKSYLFRIFKKNKYNHNNIYIYFRNIGKKSKAHYLAISQYRARKHCKNKEAGSTEVLKILEGI